MVAALALGAQADFPVKSGDCFDFLGESRADSCDEAEPFKCRECRVKSDAALFKKVAHFHAEADRLALRRIRRKVKRFSFNPQEISD